MLYRKPLMFHKSNGGFSGVSRQKHGGNSGAELLKQVHESAKKLIPIDEKDIPKEHQEGIYREIGNVYPHIGVTGVTIGDKNINFVIKQGVMMPYTLTVEKISGQVNPKITHHKLPQFAKKIDFSIYNKSSAMVGYEQMLQYAIARDIARSEKSAVVINDHNTHRLYITRFGESNFSSQERTLASIVAQTTNQPINEILI